MEKLTSLLKGDKVTVEIGKGDFINLLLEMVDICPSCSTTKRHINTYGTRKNDLFNCTIYIKDNSVYYYNAGDSKCPAYVKGDFTFKVLEEI